VKKYILSLQCYPENNLFTLEGTNTYWRFEAVACEGYRFFCAFTWNKTFEMLIPCTHTAQMIELSRFNVKKLIYLTFMSKIW